MEAQNSTWERVILENTKTLGGVEVKINRLESEVTQLNTKVDKLTEKVDEVTQTNRWIIGIGLMILIAVVGNIFSQPILRVLSL